MRRMCLILAIKTFAIRIFLDDQKVYTSDWLNARLEQPVFSDDLTKVKFVEQRNDLGVSREVICNLDLQTLTLSNIQARKINGQAGDT